MRSTGQRWEQRERYLCKQGLQSLERNYSCRGGEVDLIMRDQQSLVFVEVKFRQRGDFGSGADAVTVSKRRRVVHAAGLYLASNPAMSEHPCRFDVISIEGGIMPRYQWIKNAFNADD